MIFLVNTRDESRVNIDLKAVRAQGFCSRAAILTISCDE